MEIHYRLKRMEESEFMFKHDFDFGSVSIEEVSFQFSHQISISPQNGEIALTMQTELTPSKSNVVISRESVFCVFWIEPFDKVIQVKEDGFTTNEPLLVDTFINIAIGALRGLLVKNLKGTPLDGCVLPLISMDVIRQNSMRQ